MIFMLFYEYNRQYIYTILLSGSHRKTIIILSVHPTAGVHLSLQAYMTASYIELKDIFIYYNYNIYIYIFIHTETELIHVIIQLFDLYQAVNKNKNF